MEITNLLNERKNAIGRVRSYLQHLELLGPNSSEAFHNTTAELIKYSREVFEQGILCKTCQPDLVMIADPEYYKEHRTELARRNGQFDDGPIASSHMLGIKPDELQAIRFMGIRGMNFSIPDKSRHIDCLEIDPSNSISYFGGLNENGRDSFVRDYFDYLTRLRPNERAHLIRFAELYISFVSRRPPDYDFSVDKAIKMK